LSDPGTLLPNQPESRGRLGDFSAVSVPQYAALGLMAVSAIILAMWFMSWSTTPTWDLVASGLSPAQAAQVSEELMAADIEHRLANGGSAVEVPSAAASEAAVAVGDLASVAGAIEGYELLDQQGFMASSFRQRIDYQRAIEGELTRTILGLEEVTSATVHLAIPEERLFSEDQDQTRASVLVGGQLTQSTVASITNLVGSAVPGLDPANVTVADTSGRVLSGVTQSGGFSSDRQLQMQELYETQLEVAAQSMLSVALGPGRAVVRVTADLNFDELESETVSYLADEQVTLREQRLDEAFSGDNATPLGTLGSAEDVTQASELAGEDGSAYIRQELNSEFGVPTTTTISRQAPGAVTRITVAVILDESLDPAPDTAVLEPLVAAAVGLDAERGDTIVVESIQFDAPSEEEALAAEEAAVAAPPGAGLDPIIGYAKTGAAVVAMLLALLFLRKGLKTLIASDQALDAADEPEARELPSGDTPAVGTGTGSEASGPAMLGSSDTASSATTIDMLDLIDSQSDEVAHLLRDLVSEGAV